MPFTHAVPTTQKRIYSPILQRRVGILLNMRESNI
jgi:hypothetical protein